MPLTPEAKELIESHVQAIMKKKIAQYKKTGRSFMFIILGANAATLFGIYNGVTSQVATEVSKATSSTIPLEVAKKSVEVAQKSLQASVEAQKASEDSRILIESTNSKHADLIHELENLRLSLCESKQLLDDFRKLDDVDIADKATKLKKLMDSNPDVVTLSDKFNRAAELNQANNRHKDAILKIATCLRDIRGILNKLVSVSTLDDKVEKEGETMKMKVNRWSNAVAHQAAIIEETMKGITPTEVPPAK